MSFILEVDVQMCLNERICEMTTGFSLQCERKKLIDELIIKGIEEGMEVKIQRLFYDQMWFFLNRNSHINNDFLHFLLMQIEKTTFSLTFITCLSPSASLPPWSELHD